MVWIFTLERESLYQEIADITIETSEKTVRYVVQKITNILMEEK